MEKKELIGVVAVKSGQLLIIDPTCLGVYNPKQLSQKVSEAVGSERRYGQIVKTEIGNSQLAFALNSGYSDGSYGVYAKWDQNGKIAGVEIDFGQMFLTD